MTLIDQLVKVPASKTNVKQVIIVRRDLKMRGGKLAAQVAHASMAFLTNYLRIQVNARHCHLYLSEVERMWLNDAFTKVVLGVADEAEFHQITQAAKGAGLVANAILDEGRTAFHGEATWTAAAIGPDTAAKIDPITGHLKLL